MDYRDLKVKDLLLQEAGKFIARESNYQSLITPTNIEMSKDGKYVTIFVSVFPEDKEKPVIDFLKRKRSAFKHFIKNDTRVARIPFVDFEIDQGEKARQKIEKISQDIKREHKDDCEGCDSCQ